MQLQKFSVLSDSDIRKIHDASVEILSSIGVRVLSDQALDRLDVGGAKVDRTAKTAVFSPQLIEDSIKSVPSRFAIYSRDGNESLTIGDRYPKCASGHNAVFMVDPFTGERRYATVRDIEEFAIVSDRLQDIDIVGVPLSPQGVPDPEGTLLYAIKALFENTNKPLFFSTESARVNHAAIELMRVLAKNGDVRSYPNAISQLSSTSPLYWEAGAIDSLIDTSEQGIPLNILPEPMSGVSAPNSVAGLLTIHNTEVLSGIVISQIAAKGAPLMYGSSWTTYEMKYNNAIIGSPETTVLRIAGAQMAEYYDVPAQTTAPNTDANTHDEQSAWEKSLSTFCSLAAHNDIVMNSGMFACGLSISLEQLVIDDEVNGYARRLCRGVDVSDKSIDLASIKKIGHGGNYLMEDLTVENLRSGEYYYYKVTKNNNYDAWSDEGKPDIVERAHIKVQEYLDAGTEHAADAAQKYALAAVISDFENAR